MTTVGDRRGRGDPAGGPAAAAPSTQNTAGDAIRVGGLAQLGLLIGPLLTMVDSGIVNVAVANIASEMHASLDRVQWVVSGYLLALAAGLAASAFLARRFGTLRVYTASLIGFITPPRCAPQRQTSSYSSPPAPCRAWSAPPWCR
jgi:hypothetical protein